MDDCSVDNLTYADGVLYCSHCGWYKKQGPKQTLSELVSRIGRLHVHDFPDDELGLYRIIERLMSEGRAHAPSPAHSAIS